MMKADATKRLRFPSKLFELLVGDEKADSLESAFEETYLTNEENGGRLRARVWYGWHLFVTLNLILCRKILWSGVMIRNYFRIAIRNMMKQKVYSLITLTGLAIGFGVFLFFFRFFAWAAGADGFHRDADRIHVAVQVFDSGVDGERHTSYMSKQPIMALASSIPEIESATRIYEPGRMVIQQDDRLFYEHFVTFVDPHFLSFFDFPVFLGNREQMLSEPNSIVLSRRMAEKYFGDSTPLGEVMTLNNRVDVTVTGMIGGEFDLHYLTTFAPDFVVSMETARTLFGEMENGSDFPHTGFVRLSPGVTPDQLEAKCTVVLNQHVPDAPDSPNRMYLFPMMDIAFNAHHIDNYYGSNSFIAYVFFLVIGGLFLLIVCINFVNMSTAKYTARLKEVGLRKVVGARRSQLISQFLGESVLMTLAAMPLAALVFDVSCSLFFQRIGYNFRFTVFNHGLTLAVFLLIVLLTGIVAGLYPAFFLSSFRPSQVLKNQARSGVKRGRMRRFLVILQFTISTIIIVIAIAWSRQSTFVYRVDRGYDRENVVVVPLFDHARENCDLLQDAVRDLPAVSSVSAAESRPPRWRTKDRIIPEGLTDADATMMYAYGIDYDLLDVLDIPLVAGRSFSPEYQDEDAYIVNRMFAERVGWSDPVGKSMTVGGKEGTIVGMAEDFHLDNLFYPMGPAVFTLERENRNYLYIELTHGDHQEAVVAFVEDQWNAMTPYLPFNPSTLEDYFEQRTFNDTTLIAEIIALVGGIAIFFSCLGLLALASYSVRQRTKEIGIRKVLGATIPDVLRILGRDFLKLVLVADVIAVPVAYLVTVALLDFAFSRHIPVGVDLFVVACAFTFLTALAAVSSQTIRASRVNPVDSLRYE